MSATGQNDDTDVDGGPDLPNVPLLDDAIAFDTAAKRKENAKTKTEKQRAKTELTVLTARHSGNTLRLSKQLEELTHLEARVSIFHAPDRVSMEEKPSTAMRR